SRRFDGHRQHGWASGKCHGPCDPHRCLRNAKERTAERPRRDRHGDCHGGGLQGRLLSGRRCGAAWDQRFADRRKPVVDEVAGIQSRLALARSRTRTRKNCPPGNLLQEGFSLVGKEGLEPPTFTMSKSSWGRPPLSFNVQKWLHDGLFGTWMILPVSADVRHFPCHRQYIGSTNRLEPNGSQPLRALGRWS